MGFCRAEGHVVMAVPVLIHGDSSFAGCFHDIKRDVADALSSSGVRAQLDPASYRPRRRSPLSKRY